MFEFNQLYLDLCNNSTLILYVKKRKLMNFKLPCQA